MRPRITPVAEIIFLNGDFGAGKTEVGKKLAERLGYEFLSTGNFFRAEAEERGITFAQLHELMKTDKSVDEKIDAKVKAFVTTHRRVVVDSRVGPYFEANGFAVYFQVDSKVGAQRIFEDLEKNPARKSEAGVTCVEEVLENNAKRLESEKIRYLGLYQYDHTNLDNYNMSITTTEMRLEEVANVLMAAYRTWFTTGFVRNAL